QYPGGKIFNSAAFTTPPKGEQGNFPRNYLRGFAASQVDFALQREFKLTEKLNLRFRGEFFNLFNHPNFGSPNNSLTSPLFGYSTQTLANSLGAGGANGGLNPLYQIGGPRSSCSSNLWHHTYQEPNHERELEQGYRSDPRRSQQRQFAAELLWCALSDFLRLVSIPWAGSCGRSSEQLRGSSCRVFQGWRSRRPCRSPCRATPSHGYPSLRD